MKVPAEYYTAYKKLNPQNKQIIRKMKYYLNSHYLNEVCYDSLMDDIVGMALESEGRGEDFADTVGLEYKVFCSELVTNTLRQSHLERILGAITWLIGYVGIIVPVMYLFALAFRLPDVHWQGIMLVTPMELIFKYLLIVLAVNVAWMAVKRCIYHSPTVIVASFLTFITLTVILADYITMQAWVQRQLVEINVLLWVLAFTFVVLLLLVTKHAVALYHARKNHCA